MNNTLLLNAIHSQSLHGKKALIFGASSGLGYACAETLASLGADVVLVARNQAKLEQAVLQIKQSFNVKLDYDVQDVTHLDSLAVLLEKHSDTDILITNCGGPRVAPLASLSLDEWEEAWQSQIRSVVQSVQTIVPNMVKKGWGRVIMLASITIKNPLKGFALSNAIRPGLLGLSATLTQEHAHQNITFNLVSPGITRTERIEKLIQQLMAQGQSESEVIAQLSAKIPSKRLTKAEEVAAMVGFLSSHAAGAISGQNLIVDGGQSVAD
ncbi:MAG: SDR family oxidoreductase [Methylococcales bacterium]